jgi:membrane-associated phospholipid phosphatase
MGPESPGTTPAGDLQRTLRHPELRSTNAPRPWSVPLLADTIRRPVAVVAVLGVLTAAALAVLYSGQTGPGRLDRWAGPWLEHSAFVGRRPALYLDLLGNHPGAALMITSLVAVCAVWRDWRLTLLAVAGPGATIAMTTVAKPVIGRTIHGGYLSYPSGHTALFTAVAYVLALLVARRLRLGRLPAMLVILGAAGAAGVAMAWAEAGLTAHYLTDTIGGLGAAAAIVPATAWLIDLSAGAGRAPPPAADQLTGINPS